MQNGLHNIRKVFLIYKIYSRFTSDSVGVKVKFRQSSPIQIFETSKERIKNNIELVDVLLETFQMVNLQYILLTPRITQQSVPTLLK